MTKPTKRRANFTWNALLLASTALTGAAASTNAYAQDSSGGLDDIIITAPNAKRICKMCRSASKH